MHPLASQLCPTRMAAQSDHIRVFCRSLASGGQAVHRLWRGSALAAGDASAFCRVLRTRIHAAPSAATPTATARNPGAARPQALPAVSALVESGIATAIRALGHTAPSKGAAAI
jgi:hypothetical protein